MKFYKTLIVSIFSLLLITLCLNISAQVIITGLSENPQLIKKYPLDLSLEKSDEEYESVKLPFFDDFSYSSLYPDPALWVDRQAFVNNTFPIRPPTIGVATLDALNEKGRVYAHASTTVFPADTLTSRPIRLDSIFNPNRPIRISDSLYFSFYYQPGGGSVNNSAIVEWERIGDEPERNDVLILEFGYNTGDSTFYGFSYTEMIAEVDYQPGDSILNPYFTDIYYYFTEYVFAGTPFQMPSDSLFQPLYVWNEVWSTEGVSLDDWLSEDPVGLIYFKLVMIPIVDEIYLRDNFQFRFRNYASLEDRGIAGWAGNVDQWHIDYVMLNYNRRADDIYPNDVAFVSPTTTILQKYQAMPWKQFRQSDLKSSFHNQLVNISSSEKNTSYGYTVLKNGTDMIGNLVTNNENALPYYNNGLHDDIPFHVDPPIDFEIPLDGADSAYVVINHIFEVVGMGDICRRNDTCTHIQRFYNYYAYDDGTAEAGISVLSTMYQPQAYLAVRFQLAQPDTLQAIKMWFNRVLNDANVASFTLKVWRDQNGLPGEELYSQEALQPSHADDYLNFVTYKLAEPFIVSGSFFVGFYQNHKTQLNIGFDQNSDARGEVFSNTSNEWEEVFYLGAPMIRPLLGSSHGIGIPENREPARLTLYPNPTNGVVNVVIPENQNITKILVYDLYGKMILSKDYQGDNSIDLSSYAAGVYFMKLLSHDRQAGTGKIVKY